MESKIRTMINNCKHYDEQKQTLDEQNGSQSSIVMNKEHKLEM